MLVSHFFHGRIDPNSNDLLEYIDDLRQMESLYMVVYNEDIPGARQYRLEDLIVKRARFQNISEEESRKRIMKQIEEVSTNQQPWFDSANVLKAILGSHDDTTVEHVVEAKQFGSTLSEMPTTLRQQKKQKS